MGVGDRHRVVVVAIAHERLAREPARPLIAGVERRRGQIRERRPVLHQARGDRLALTAEHRLLSRRAALAQHRVQLGDVAGARERNHERPAGEADQALHRTLAIGSNQWRLQWLTRSPSPAGRTGRRRGSGIAGRRRDGCACASRHRGSAPRRAWYYRTGSTADHLRHRPADDPEPSCRLAVAQTVTHHHAPHQAIQVHAVHPPASGSF